MATAQLARTLYPEDLPNWAKMALTENVLHNTSLKDLAEKYNKHERTLEKYSTSPAGKRWKNKLQAIVDDPVQQALLLVRASAAGLMVDYLFVTETASKSGDLAVASANYRDLLNRAGASAPEKKDATPTRIVINLGNGVSLEAPVVQSEAKALPGEVTTDFEIVESDGRDADA